MSYAKISMVCCALAASTSLASATCARPSGAYAGAGAGPIFFKGQPLAARAEVFTLVFPTRTTNGSFTWTAKSHPTPGTTDSASIHIANGSIPAIVTPASGVDPVSPITASTWDAANCKGTLIFNGTETYRAIKSDGTIDPPLTSAGTSGTFSQPYIFTSSNSGNTLTLTLFNYSSFLAANTILLERQ
jgi:hypothetical protein